MILQDKCQIWVRIFLQRKLILCKNVDQYLKYFQFKDVSFNKRFAWVNFNLFNNK